MNSRNAFIIATMLVLVIPFSTISGETSQEEALCGIVTDWSNGTASEHAYVINNWSIVNGTDTLVNWLHVNETGILIDNGTISPIEIHNDSDARFSLPTSMNLGDTISIQVVESETDVHCSRNIDITCLLYTSDAADE